MSRPDKRWRRRPGIRQTSLPRIRPRGRGSAATGSCGLAAFGGIGLIAGPLIEATSVTTVVLPGALGAIALGWWADTRTDRPYAH